MKSTEDNKNEVVVVQVEDNTTSLHGEINFQRKLMKKCEHRTYE
jgi:hypothetical protein